ncbi:MFS transporter [Thermoanaerobacterium saccharolyticum]|uniref:MFS transporter n=1 Tax=Thermoanaerobacterium saccharolyticum TaxID=28896 RepID=UPI0005EE555C
MLNSKIKINKQFVFVWFAELISILGSGLTDFGLSVWIYEKTGKATPLAISILFSVLPAIFLSQIAGFVADKFNTKKVVIFFNTGAAIVSFAFIFLLRNNYFNLFITYIIILLIAAFNLFESAAVQSSIVYIVDKENLKTANGMNQVSDSLNNLLTPVIAGILYTFIGLQGIIIIDLVTYVISMAIWMFFPARIFNKEFENEKMRENRWSWNQFINNLNDGFKFIFARKGLTLLVFLFAIANFLNNLAVVLITPLMLSIGNSTQLGIVQTFGGIGMFIGSFIATLHKSDTSYTKTIKSCILSASVFLLLIGIRASFITVSLCRMLFLLFIPISNVAAGTLWQLKTPKELQGRVYTARSMIIRCIMPVAYLIVGPITDVGFKNILTVNNRFIDFIKNLLGVSALNYRLVFILSGITLFIVTYSFFKNKSLSDIDKLPDYAK